MNARFSALKEIGRNHCLAQEVGINSENFGSRIFSRSLMQKMLPRQVYKNVLNAMNGIEKIQPEYADTIALAVKEWALSHHATHYCHWFQPLTSAGAEKHDAFIDWNSSDSVIEKFDGKQLIQGEPDASSFPSGGLRSTYEARGYTGWDPTSPIFLWKAGDGITLCIPSVFFSWTGATLDNKIPLLRSDWKINQAAQRLMRLVGHPVDYVYSTLGLEQEYFTVDRALRNLRPDLVLLGKTVFGAPSPKGQELQDHYFGPVKDRILCFMCEFETAAIELGIPVKTRHNEVAPSQYEVAPVFEKASTAVDHNILLMELMRQIAQKHGLACLLHEKPFAGINGSGKHANWSLATHTGMNLLDPAHYPSHNWHFCILLAAILNGVHRHAALLRASIGSASNDYRLGGHEAPPAIISVYLGQELEAFLNEFEQKGSLASSFEKGKYDLGLLVLPDLSRDNTDRNRTSPLAFTGNKFEFRAVGSSSNPALAATVLNLVVAESLNVILDEIEASLQTNQPNLETLANAAIPVLQKYFKLSKNIRFSGDNYSENWVQEASKRNLPNITKSAQAFAAFSDPKTVDVFKEILTKEELISRQEIFLEHYAHHMNIEANLMIDIFKSQILPVAFDYQHTLAQSYRAAKECLEVPSDSKQQLYLKKLHRLIENGIQVVEELELARQQAADLSFAKKAHCYSGPILQKMEQLRAVADELEGLIDDRIWPLPKYRELLFIN
jgi:glutamine synthetase